MEKIEIEEMPGNIYLFAQVKAETMIKKTGEKILAIKLAPNSIPPDEFDAGPEFKDFNCTIFLNPKTFEIEGFMRKLVNPYEKYLAYQIKDHENQGWIVARKEPGVAYVVKTKPPWTLIIEGTALCYGEAYVP